MLSDAEGKEISKLYERQKKVCEEETYKPIEKFNNGLIRLIVGSVVIVIFLWIIFSQAGLYNSEICMINLALGLAVIFLFFICIIGGLSRILRYYKDIKFYAKFFSWFYDLENFFLINHLNKIDMKYKLKDNDFMDYLDFNKEIIPDVLRFKKKDKERLLSIFKKIQKRANKVDISKDCKSDFTPWEFFRKTFFGWFIQKNIIIYKNFGQELCYNYDFKIANINFRDALDQLDVYEKLDFFKAPISRSSGNNEIKFSASDTTKWFLYFQIFTFFKEFESAPRISGDLVIQLEDTLDKAQKITNINKEGILSIVERWRRYKTENRLKK